MLLKSLQLVIFIIFIYFFIRYLLGSLKPSYNLPLIELIAGMIGIGIIIHGGVKELLFWLPSSLGRFNEDGIFITLREGISGCCAVAAAFYLPQLIGKGLKYDVLYEKFESLSECSDINIEEIKTIFEVNFNRNSLPQLNELKRYYRDEQEKYDEDNCLPEDIENGEHFRKLYDTLIMLVDLRIKDIKATL